MTFEEQFPSLAKFHISEKAVRSGIDPKYLTDDLFDKQRVREALNNLRTCMMCDRLKEDLFEELGL